jgi:hypothetical protein
VKNRPVVRDFLISLSLATLVLIGEWQYLLGGSYSSPPIAAHFLAVMLCTFILAAVFSGAMWLVRRSGETIHLAAKWLFLQTITFSLGLFLILSFPFQFAGLESAPALSAAFIKVVLFCAVIVILPPLLLTRLVFFRWVLTLTMLCSPCVAYLFARAVWQMLHPGQPAVVQGSLERLSTSGPRVLLLVFDEMSEYVAFAKRPAGLEMPAFDRLRRQSVTANAAFPPGRATIISMPALLAGRPMKEVAPSSRDELVVRYPGSKLFQSFTGTPTVFTDVRALGFGTAMIGWYHPYCSLLQDLDFCAHTHADMVDQNIERGGVFAKSLDVIADLPVLRSTDWTLRRKEQAICSSFESESAFLFQTTKAALPKFRSGLMIVHLPIPHPPAKCGEGLYFRNLANADSHLQEIRSVMEASGTWEGTTVIVTSDHYWRTHAWQRDWRSLQWTPEELNYIDADKDHRIPFIAKLPDQQSSLAYTNEFNTLLVSKLVRECLTEKIRTPEDLRAWLDMHRTDVAPHAYADTVNPE